MSGLLVSIINCVRHKVSWAMEEFIQTGENFGLEGRKAAGICKRTRGEIGKTSKRKRRERGKISKITRG